MPAPSNLVTIRPGVTLEAGAAASFQRVEAVLGRVGVNSSYRDWAEQWQLYLDWVAWQNGTGPKAPMALHPDKSMHCKGLAIDTDSVTRMRGAESFGWRSTVPTEDWHFDYFPGLDEYRGQAAGGGSIPFPTPTIDEGDDEDMDLSVYVIQDGEARTFALAGPHFWWEGFSGDVANRLVVKHNKTGPVGNGTETAINLTYAEWAGLKAACG